MVKQDFQLCFLWQAAMSLDFDKHRQLEISHSNAVYVCLILVKKVVRVGNIQRPSYAVQFLMLSQPFSKRCVVALQSWSRHFLISAPMNLRSNRDAARPNVPLPANGSTIKSPSLVRSRIKVKTSSSPCAHSAFLLSAPSISANAVLSGALPSTISRR